jgi:hypothetical protein
LRRLDDGDAHGGEARNLAACAHANRRDALTAEYIAGRRRRYLNPVQLFLLVNLVFFAMLSTVGLFQTFTTRLQYHRTQFGYGWIADRLVERQGPGGSPEGTAFEQRFDEVTPRVANSLVILMAPLLAAFLALLFITKRRYYVHHLDSAVLRRVSGAGVNAASICYGRI